jgi:hypothetical protein
MTDTDPAVARRTRAARRNPQHGDAARGRGTRRHGRPGHTTTAVHRPHRGTTTGAGTIDIAKILEYVGLVVAPTTLVSALVYWLGFELVDARSTYFGLGTGTLDFSPTDYFVRGAEAGVVPVFVLFTAVLAGAVLHHLVTAVGAVWAGSRGTRLAAWTVLACGGAVFATAFVGLFTPPPPSLNWYLLRPVLLAAGPLAAIQGLRLLHAGTDTRTSRTAVMGVAGLVAVSAFWAMSIYADALGRGRAVELGSHVRDLPAVRVYSDRSLALDPAVAAGRQLPDGEARYRYHYAGLRLLVRSRGKYFLVPDGWTRTTGAVLVLPDTADIRVEFSPGGS